MGTCQAHVHMSTHCRGPHELYYEGLFKMKYLKHVLIPHHPHQADHCWNGIPAANEWHYYLQYSSNSQKQFPLQYSLNFPLQYSLNYIFTAVSFQYSLQCTVCTNEYLYWSSNCKYYSALTAKPIVHSAGKFTTNEEESFSVSLRGRTRQTTRTLQSPPLDMATQNKRLPPKIAVTLQD